MGKAFFLLFCDQYTVPVSPLATDSAQYFLYRPSLAFRDEASEKQAWYPVAEGGCHEKYAIFVTASMMMAQYSCPVLYRGCGTIRETAGATRSIVEARYIVQVWQ